MKKSTLKHHLGALSCLLDVEIYQVYNTSQHDDLCNYHFLWKWCLALVTLSVGPQLKGVIYLIVCVNVFLGLGFTRCLLRILWLRGLLVRTRSYAALRAADLDWIVRPGYSSGRYIGEKTMKNQPGTMKTHENQPGTTKNQLRTMKNHENQPGTMKNYEKSTWNLEKP